MLERIEQNPDATQASLAQQLGVAVGTVNWHIRRLINKGYIKVRRAERRKLRYLITPEGMSFRAHLTVDFIQNSMQIYRETRRQVLACLADVRQAGFGQVRLVGDGDIGEICRLTCLEQSISLSNEPGLPALEVHGLKVILVMEETK